MARCLRLLYGRRPETHSTFLFCVLAGPGIATPNSSFGFLASNVDTMPTIFGLAGPVQQQNPRPGLCQRPLLTS